MKLSKIVTSAVLVMVGMAYAQDEGNGKAGQNDSGWMGQDTAPKRVAPTSIVGMRAMGAPEDDSGENMPMASNGDSGPITRGASGDEGNQKKKKVNENNKIVGQDDDGEEDGDKNSKSDEEGEDDKDTTSTTQEEDTVDSDTVIPSITPYVLKPTGYDLSKASNSRFGFGFAIGEYGVFGLAVRVCVIAGVYFAL
ncbi:hypothetical protein BB560_007120 [Smittium megazygosporum]|uniref:Uncharacterized protein n=1 Tax=Smittium megazygosporum TaxID=133381 RepID=A0A2T9XYR3_9FUNG|nr:hypothetical protein BB560_007120 [Smittium megazygosporum]